MENEIIWSSRLDDTFDVKVERLAPYNGELVIIQDGKELLRETVSISYNALFGPDIADLDQWTQRCCEFVDALSKK